ncbi:ATP synthase F0 [Pyrenophora seminiperda CCB06]|uniref:ATP synthase F0 n=1 Tax=Pyrenophora seminiperda CCB06 TaxID=1302712 RepID=A0A3M7MFU6_9PLEO|nr:ATP synthase F0 [Pyrenophora seminiperda CCB06]
MIPQFFAFPTIQEVCCTPFIMPDVESQRTVDSPREPVGHTAQSILLYKITTSLSYLLLLVCSFYYVFHAPAGAHSHRFWQNNSSTPFAQSSIFTSIYWLILFALQLGYAYALYVPSEATVNFAANIGSHFIANNLLLFGFVNLFVRSHFWLAEFLLVVNFFNLTFAYFRHSNGPRWVHVGALSGPLAWNFAALYWCGALAVHSNHFVARIVANVFIWGWVGYGMFYLITFKDYTMGFALSALAFSTGVGQFLTRPHLFQLQWIFAFTIGGLLFLLSLAVGMPGLLGRDPFPRGQIVSEDRERAPLLSDD